MKQATQDAHNSHPDPADQFRRSFHQEARLQTEPVPAAQAPLWPGVNRQTQPLRPEAIQSRAMQFYGGQVVNPGRYSDLQAEPPGLRHNQGLHRYCSWPDHVV